MDSQALDRGLSIVYTYCLPTCC